MEEAEKGIIQCRHEWHRLTVNQYCKAYGPSYPRSCPGCHSIFTELIEPAPEDIRQQNHYARFPIQPVVFIAENNLDFLTGNIIKYVLRHDAKDGLKDLEKARHYLDMLIQKTKGEKVQP